MKEKLEALRASIKALLDDAETLIKDSKFDEAKVKQDEAKKQKAQFETIKAQIDARESEEKSAQELKVAELEKKNAELAAAAAKPIRPPFEDGTEPTPEGDGIKSFVTLKYGETDAATKAVISDLYGSKFNYNQARHDQMGAFVKYVRFGENRLSAAESALLHASAKNIILRPDMIKAEIEAGSWKVIAEARESGNVGLYRDSGEVRQGLVDEILTQIPAETIIWEAPQKAQQVWFIKLIGSNINLGNIAPVDVIPVETLRLGLRSDTFDHFLNMETK